MNPQRPSMHRLAPATALLLLALSLRAPAAPAPAPGPQWVLSGNETKIDLTGGAPRRVAPESPDSLTLMDFATFPPRVTHLPGVSNSVIGPPSNIAITPDGALALIANSIRLDPANATNWVPESHVTVLDLRSTPPRVTGHVATGPQPSGISIHPDGRRALVANRAGGTLSVLGIHGTQVTALGEVPVCGPADSLSDVAISPDGKTVLASVQKGGYLALLKWDGSLPSLTGQKVSTYGQPYRVVITPDGQLGLTAGAGAGNRLDHDALTVVDLGANPVRAVDYVALGPIPESIEVSPDGRWVAAVLMDGSNLAANDPLHTEAGTLVLLERTDRTYRVRHRVPVGRIPEGVAFTPDGRHVLVQCHADREIRILELRRGRVRDTGTRVSVPGFPSSIRALP